MYWKEISDLTTDDKKIQTDRKDKYSTLALRKKNANAAPKISVTDSKRVKT